MTSRRTRKAQLEAQRASYDDVVDLRTPDARIDDNDAEGFTAGDAPDADFALPDDGVTRADLMEPLDGDTAPEDVVLRNQAGEEIGPEDEVPGPSPYGAAPAPDSTDDTQPDLGSATGRPWREIDAPRPTDEELGREPVPLHPIELPARRHYTLVSEAIEARLTRLEKLGNDVEKEGYPKEARIFKGDAALLREDALPEFSALQELPLVTPGELRYKILNVFTPLVKRCQARIRDGGPEMGDEAVRILLDQLAVRVGTYAERVAEKAYHLGYSDRFHTPTGIALASAGHLEITNEKTPEEK